MKMSIEPDLGKMNSRLETLEQDSLCATAVRELLNSKASSRALHEDILTSVPVHGREHKPIKVVCNSRDSRLLILTSIKRDKPKDLFINEYLTKVRSKLLFRLLTLKRQYPHNISSVCSRNRSFFHKLTGDARPRIVHAHMSEINKIEVMMLNRKKT